MRTLRASLPVQNGMMQSTLLLVLGAETALFGTLVMSYLFLRTGGSDMVFPHPTPLDFAVASLNTLILLTSAVLAGKAHRFISRDRADLLKKNLIFALVLGLVFVAGQIIEFNRSGMKVDDLTFGGVFFALISFHALHVLAGISVLAINLVRAYQGDFNAQRHIAVTAGTWFWQYVAAVWLVLFILLYVI